MNCRETAQVSEDHAEAAIDLAEQQQQKICALERANDAVNAENKKLHARLTRKTNWNCS